MNILILSGSPRKGGNTELLAEAFAKGAAEHQGDIKGTSFLEDAYQLGTSL